MESSIRHERGINILSLGRMSQTFRRIVPKTTFVDAGSLAGVLSQMHILADFMERLAAIKDAEEELLPSDHFDLIGASGIAA